MFGRCSAIATLLCTLLISAPTHALRIDPETVNVVYEVTGLKITEKTRDSYPLFEFSPFVVYRSTHVPGFSDPLGLGEDPMFKVFAGRVHHMDLLGDFTAFNPYDPADLEPTPDSLQASLIVNYLLYGHQMPTKHDLMKFQLNVAYIPKSKFSSLPRTRETGPLSLAGFGSVSELAKPVHLHWTHCPDYAYKRYLYKKTKKAGAGLRKSRPANDCFLI